MRKYGVVLALVVVSVVVWVASASAISSPQTFSLLAVDNGRGQPFNNFMFQRSPVAGDQFPISEDLYKWAGTKRGAKVGSDRGAAEFLVVTNNGANGWAVFNVQANLPGGTIIVSGQSANEQGPSKFTLAVTGGTGIYANARGYVNVRGMAGNKTNLDFHLLP
jgi:hypothetical protein